MRSHLHNWRNKYSRFGPLDQVDTDTPHLLLALDASKPSRNLRLRSPQPGLARLQVIRRGPSDDEDPGDRELVLALGQKRRKARHCSTSLYRPINPMPALPFSD